MSKFIQTVDENNRSVIINLEAISHVFRFDDGNLPIYFCNRLDNVVLKGQQADIFWEFMTKASWQINQQPQEDEK
ncbi:hypothetical protein NIES4075_44420 [Tolypothrix sp. NIES-4075]|uniref:hypothetical protein n=1 Tax=Tolypothrix sp. NIES-4075 TaxID=2005459 RepID=UPI000B5C2950|nr:hypothetical protein [Tolypothrix sp. NIES-4075]GAX43429.1 hypothetical protein NIES4075_44420 [Tolypothrix sp. NIES-4075]